MTKSFVTIADLSKEKIMSLLEAAARFEENPNRKTLDGKVIATHGGFDCPTDAAGGLLIVHIETECTYRLTRYHGILEPSTSTVVEGTANILCTPPHSLSFFLREETTAVGYAVCLAICCSRASFSISGKTFPRRSALLKIPSQATALK